MVINDCSLIRDVYSISTEDLSQREIRHLKSNRSFFLYFGTACGLEQVRKISD